MRDLTSSEQHDLFVAVTGCEPFDDDELDDFIADVALTHQPVEDYGIKADTLYSGFQVAKGLRRGDLFIRDFGDFRAVYFTGECIQ